MGEIADMMLEGALCEGCGAYLEKHGTGPRRCTNCGGLSSRTVRSINRVVGRQRAAERHNRERHAEAKLRKPFECHCGKLCRTADGLKAHQQAKHGSGGW